MSKPTHHRFETPGLAQYAYLIASNGHAAVIDPIRNITPILDYAAAHSLTITHVLETHIHADFASGATALAAATGAELALSAYDQQNGKADGQAELYHYAMPHRPLRTGDRIDIGDLRLEALHTPGHTPEHLSFVLFDAASAPEPTAIFSGDFLFVGSLGRPDLLGEAAARNLAHELYRSVHERIAALPGSVRVYPGHGAGSFCGAGLSDASESTLAAERATNPLFQLDEPAFLTHILDSAPPMPAYYPRMKQLNADGPPILNPIPSTTPLTATEVATLATDPTTTVLDLRTPTAFAAAHIAGALNIGLGSNLSLWAGWLLDPRHKIILITSDDPAKQQAEAEAATLALRNVDLDLIAGHLAGGLPAWLAAHLPIATTTLVTPAQLPAQALTLDVRNASEYALAHIPNALPIPLGDLPQRFNELSTDQPITLVCEGGYRASIAASLLARHGFTHLAVLAGGMEAWHRSHA